MFVFSVVLGMIFLDSISLPLPNTTAELFVSTNKQQEYTDTFLIPQEPDSLSMERMKQANITLSPPATVSMNACPLTSQVRLVVSRRDNQHWIIESLDVNGNRKTMGGDEYYVTYTDDAATTTSTGPTAVAFVRDLGDGTYELRFVTTPSLNTTTTITTKSAQSGTVSITLQYSCGIGHLAPPIKANWSTGGAINANYMMIHDTISAPAMENFLPPRDKINLGQYDKVICYGDSTMGNLVSVGRPNLVWPAGNVGAPLNTETIRNPRTRDGKTFPSMLTQIKSLVTAMTKQYNNVALLIGSGVWDIIADDEGKQGPQFHDHRTALRQLIVEIQQAFPNLPIYWKSHTAMHIHQVADKKDWYHLERVFYMSSSRSYDLYRYQKEIMRDLNVSILDLYPATYLSAHHLERHDGRHYSLAFNEKMLSWFSND